MSCTAHTYAPSSPPLNVIAFSSQLAKSRISTRVVQGPNHDPYSGFLRDTVRIAWYNRKCKDPVSFVGSATASLISCWDQRCALGAEFFDSGCVNHNLCGHTFQYYGDGRGTSEDYV